MTHDLTAIYLCHSYYKGLLTRIPSTGHTNMNGTNGAGKSTTLQLIPIFYGKNPEELINRAASNDSFLDHYLPNAQSMVVFQYTRSSGPCCAVMYRLGDEGRAAYRFVAGAAEDTLFTPDAVKAVSAGLSAKEFLAGLSGVEVSNQITTIKDYRAILQNDKTLANQRKGYAKRLLADAQRFSVCPPFSHMQHMDDLTFAILKRDKMMSRLKSMIISTHIAPNTKVPVPPKNAANRNLRDELMGIKSFENIRPVIANCIAMNADRLHLQTSIHNGAQALADIQPEIQEQIESLESQLISTNKAIEDHNEAADEKTRRLQQGISSTQGEIDSYTETIERIDKAKEEFEGQDVNDKKRDLERLQGFKDQVERAQATVRSLGEKAGNHRQWRDEELRKIGQDLAGTTQSYQSKIQACRDEITALERTREQEKSQAEATAGKERDDLSGWYEGAKEPLVAQQAHFVTMAENAGRTQEEEDAVAIAVAAVDEARDKRTAASRAESAARQARETAKSHWDSRLDALKRASATREQRKSDRDQLDRIRTPDDKSLLAGLRRERPEWASDIGLVIDPDLLYRTDLKPAALQTGSSGFYGVDLALANIEPPAHVLDDAALIERLQDATLKLEASQAALDQAQKDAESAKKSFTAADKAYGGAKSELERMESSLSEADAHAKQIRRETGDAVTARRLEAKAQAKMIANSIKDLESERQKRRAAIAERCRERVADIMGQAAIGISELEADIAGYQAAIQEVKDQAAQEEALIRRAYKDRCANDGVSEETVERADQAFSHAQARLTAVLAHRELVESYDRFLVTDWASRPGYQAKLSDATERFGALNAEASDHRRESDQMERQLKATLAAINKDLGLKRALVDQISGVLKRVGAFPVRPDVEPPADIALLLKNLDRDLSTLEDLRRRVLGTVAEATRALDQSDSPKIQEAWRTLYDHRLQAIRALRPDAMANDDIFLLGLPEDLETLVEGHLPQIKDNQLSILRTLADQLSAYHDELVAVNSAATTTSNQLRKQLNTNQKIPSLSEIKLGLISKIEAIDGWTQLKKFKAELGHWTLHERDELPSESLLDALLDVISVLESSQRTPDMASLIDIEVSMTIDGKPRSARTDDDLNNMSSNGLSYLALIVIFIGLSRYLCPDKRVALVWPMDEIGTLAASNVSLLFSMLSDANIRVFGAMPNTESSFLKHFQTKVRLDINKGASIIQDTPPEDSPFRRRLNKLAEETEV